MKPLPREQTRELLEAAQKWIDLEFFKPKDEREFTADEDYCSEDNSQRMRGTRIAQYSLPAWIICKHYNVTSPYLVPVRGWIFDHFEDMMDLKWKEADDLFNAATPDQVRTVINEILDRMDLEEKHARYADR